MSNAEVLQDPVFRVWQLAVDFRHSLTQQLVAATAAGLHDVADVIDEEIEAQNDWCEVLEGKMGPAARQWVQERKVKSWLCAAPAELQEGAR